jgi:predicted RNase H-like HicB family nuclease
MFKEHTDAMKQQSELIDLWVEKEEKKRLPPLAPLSPFS